MTEEMRVEDRRGCEEFETEKVGALARWERRYYRCDDPSADFNFSPKVCVREDRKEEATFVFVGQLRNLRKKKNYAPLHHNPNHSPPLTRAHTHSPKEHA